MIIYRIINNINGKSYIGQSTLSFNKRYKGGQWWKYTHNLLLKNSISKHGLENLPFNKTSFAGALKKSIEDAVYKM